MTFYSTTVHAMLILDLLYLEKTSFLFHFLTEFVIFSCNISSVTISKSVTTVCLGRKFYLFNINQFWPEVCDQGLFT
jgi:hypothetical protein